MNKWERIKRPLAAAVLCGTMITGLQGCAEVMIGTAVMGSLAATDRRTLGAQTEDKAIVLKGETRVSRLVGEAGHVNVNSYNRKVLLTGEVRDEAMKQAVEREVAAIEGVISIVNDLGVMAPSSLSTRSNDTLITGKVKASFIDNKALQVNAFKVVTERGAVYLMGLVTQREGDLATEVARQVGGVQKVVKVFDYISEEELKQISVKQEQQQKN